MTDAQLVELLRKRPKTVPQLQTRQGFQRFFAGVAAARMRRLLAEAFADVDDAHDRVERRMELLQGFLV